MFQIAKTLDGSPTVINTTLNQSYHSMHGALRESMHVFIHEGLEFFTARFQPSSLRIFEMGFGTGLNALLTYYFAQKHHLKIHYLAVEKYPLPADILHELQLHRLLGLPEKLITLFHSFHGPVTSIAVDSNFTLTLYHSNLLKADIPADSVDLIYFDAFSPGAQPELWTEEVMEKCFLSLAKPGVWVTYSSKGDVRRALTKAGFQVEKIPGPPGKREMLRALKI